MSSANESGQYESFLHLRERDAPDNKSGVHTCYEGHAQDGLITREKV